MNIEKRLAEIKERQVEIRSMLDGELEVNVEELTAEVEALNTEKRSLATKLEVAEKIDSGEVQARSIEKPKGEIKVEERKEVVEWEKRGADLIEKRAVTVASSNLLTPTHEASDINGTFNTVSTLLDRVKVVPLNGGESYKRPYEVSHAEAGYTAEGVAYNAGDIVVDYATINKTKLTIYSEETEEVQKLPHANYSQLIVSGINKALRKKISKEILVGTGAAGQFTGIFSANALAIDPTTDKEIAAIDANTLDDIIYSYGGDEETEDTAVLILSKNDLRAFAMLRNADNVKTYQVTTNGNTGTINGVPYVINSACKSVATAATGDFLMAYGPLSNYELAVFSATDIRRSDDFKFKEGMVAHRGSVFVGGNVASRNGFLRVKRATVV